MRNTESGAASFSQSANEAFNGEKWCTRVPVRGPSKSEFFNKNKTLRWPIAFSEIYTSPAFRL